MVEVRGDRLDRRVPTCLRGDERASLWFMYGELSTLAFGLLGGLDGLFDVAGGTAVSTLLAETGYGRFVGRMHPIAVHFPIALLIVAAIVEGCRLPFSRAVRPSAFGLVAVLFAAFFASWAAASGWLNADFESHDESRTLGLHRWLGVAVAAIAIVVGFAAIVAALAKNPRTHAPGGAAAGLGGDRGDDFAAAKDSSGSQAAAPAAQSADATSPEGSREFPASRPRRAFAIYRYGVLLAGLLVAFTGHLGGELVYGEGYLMKAWPSASSANSGPEVVDESASGDATEGAGDARGTTTGDAEEDSESPEAEAETGAPPVFPDAPDVRNADQSADDPKPEGERKVGGKGDAEADAAVFEQDEQSAASADPQRFFATAVLPAMQARCVECHGPDKVKAGLRLDSLAATLAGDEFDRVVVPGDPDESILLQRVMLPRDHVDAMPPKGEGMSEAEIASLREWIAALPAE